MIKIPYHKNILFRSSNLSSSYTERINIFKKGKINKCLSFDSRNQYPVEPDFLKRTKIYLRIRFNDKLRDFWQHTKDSLLVFNFGCSVFYVDVAKLYQIPAQSFNKKRPMTRGEKQLIKFGIIQIAKFIPFIVLVIVPGGELVIPMILKFCPAFLPSGFDTFGKSIDVAIGSKLSYSINLMNKIISSRLKTLTTDVKLKELLSKKINDKNKNAYESATVGDLIDYLPFFDHDYLLRTGTLKDLKSLCKLMGVGTEGTCQHIINSIIMKAHRVRCQDYALYARLSEGLDNLPTDYLMQLCADRGISCLGHDQAKLIKRITRWVKHTVESQLPTIFMFLTRIAHYDRVDYVSDICERTDEITRGFRILLASLKTTINEKTTPSQDPQLLLFMRVKLLTLDPTEKRSKFYI